MARYVIRIVRRDNGSHPFKVYVSKFNQQPEGFADYPCDCRTMREARIYANGLAHGLSQAGHTSEIWIDAHCVNIPSLEEEQA